jgi:hypothetical protein
VQHCCVILKNLTNRPVLIASDPQQIKLADQISKDDCAADFKRELPNGNLRKQPSSKPARSIVTQIVTAQTNASQFTTYFGSRQVRIASTLALWVTIDSTVSRLTAPPLSSGQRAGILLRDAWPGIEAYRDIVMATLSISTTGSRLRPIASPREPEGNDNQASRGQPQPH